MTTLSSTRTALTSLQRRMENGPKKDCMAATKKLMEVHKQATDPHRKARAGHYLAWQTQRLSALSSAPHGDNQHEA